MLSDTTEWGAMHPNEVLGGWGLAYRDSGYEVIFDHAYGGSLVAWNHPEYTAEDPKLLFGVQWHETREPSAIWLSFMVTNERKHISVFSIKNGEVWVDSTTTISAQALREALTKKYGPAKNGK